MQLINVTNYEFASTGLFLRFFHFHTAGAPVEGHFLWHVTLTCNEFSYVAHKWAKCDVLVKGTDHLYAPLWLMIGQALADDAPVIGRGAS